MKITLMRDNDGATTMRTLDINLQIEAMKHETKAQPVTNLRTSIRYASPDYRLDEAKKLAKVIPADDRIQRNHPNRNKPSGKPRRSEPGEAGSGRTFTNFPCLHGLRRAFRKNMDKIHTSGPITPSEAGRS